MGNNGTSVFVMTVLQTGVRFDQLHNIYRSSVTIWAFNKSKCCYRIKQDWPYIPLTLKKNWSVKRNNQKNGEKWQYGNVTNVAIMLVRFFNFPKPTVDKIFYFSSVQCYVVYRINVQVTQVLIIVREAI